MATSGTSVVREAYQATVRARREVESCKKLLAAKAKDATPKPKELTIAENLVREGDRKVSRFEKEIQKVYSLGRLYSKKKRPREMRQRFATIALRCLHPEQIDPSKTQPSTTPAKESEPVAHTERQGTDSANAEQRAHESRLDLTSANTLLSKHLSRDTLEMAIEVTGRRSDLQLERLEGPAVKFGLDSGVVCLLSFDESAVGDTKVLVPRRFVVASSIDGDISEWVQPKHSVLAAINERAQVALRVCWRKWHSTCRALLEFVAWMAQHRGLLSRSKGGHGLAFDLSRECYMPPFVTPLPGKHTSYSFSRNSVDPL